MSQRRRASGAQKDAPAREPLPPGVEVHFANDELFIGSWERVLINVWRGPQRLAYAGSRGESTAILAHARNGPIALLTIVLQRAGLPDEPTRDALARLRRSNVAARIVACAGVAEGPPLRQAAARAVSIDLDQRVPPPFPTRMFAKRLDAVLWIAEALAAAGSPIDGRALIGVLAALCGE